MLWCTRAAASTLQEARDDRSSEAHGSKCRVVHPDDGWTVHSLSSVLRCLDDGLSVRQHKRVAHAPLFTAGNNHRYRVLLEWHSRMAVSTQTQRLKLVLLPGMDGTGELFSDFAAALAGEFEIATVWYPTERCLSYSELEGFVRAVCST